MIEKDKLNKFVLIDFIITKMSQRFNYPIASTIFALEITNIEIDENEDEITLGVYLGRPGTLIGKAGSDIEYLESALSQFCEKKTKISIREVHSSLYKQVGNTINKTNKYDANIIVDGPNQTDNFFFLKTINNTYLGYADSVNGFRDMVQEYKRYEILKLL